MKLTSVLRRTTRPFLFFSATLALFAVPSTAQIRQSEYAARRTALAARIQDGILIALGSPEPEEDYITFNQNSNFKYLTGFVEPEAALVMVVKSGAISGSPMLFVQASDPAREVWTGHRLGIPGVKPTLGMDGRDIETLNLVVDSLARAIPAVTLFTVGGFNSEGLMSRDDQIANLFLKNNPTRSMKSANNDVLNLRRVKTPAELDLIRRAVNITVGAQKDAMRLMDPGLNEFEVQALIEYDFRRNGADRPSFSTIVGSGPNSTTLHYNADDRFIQPADMVVMDIGASYRDYAADVTRTVPANGIFSDVQRDIYSAVRAAQAAAEAAAKVNGAARALSEAANESLDGSLARLGLIEAPGATFDCDASGNRQCPQRSLYYMHGLGHGIGLDVHDPGAATNSGTLVPGSAFTIEPGIYVQGNLLDIIPNTPKNRAMISKIGAAVKRYANIGVRIEDDYIVTDNGIDWISHAPREIAEIEAIMAEKWTGPAPRDAATVEAYRSTGLRAP